jgi:hypothetical protein
VPVARQPGGEPRDEPGGLAAIEAAGIAANVDGFDRVRPAARRLPRVGAIEVWGIETMVWGWIARRGGAGGAAARR